MSKEQQNIEDNLLKWLNEEGYPLEFETAKIFASYGFSTFQGQYITDYKTKTPREIDVIAKVTRDVDKSFLRISHAVECKWSEDKPWIVFTDQSARITPGACIAQSIATKLMDAILWYLAGDKDVQNLDLFKTPTRPGFNGRQAFSKQSDLVYSALQSVVSASYSKMNDYEKYHKKPEDSISFGVFVRPLIVIKGRLFESFYDHSDGKMGIKEQNKIRLYWRGAEAWNLHSTIDIVTINHLPQYVKKLGAELDYLIGKMAGSFVSIKECIESKSLTPMAGIKSTPRGIIGLPPLLRHLGKDEKSS